MTSDSFFAKLVAFSDFSKLAESRHYSRAPASWFAVICDIRGSTLAIEKGRYQDVNTLGAACIAVVQAASPGHDIPFVFGGDGASFLVPESLLEKTRESLLKLRVFAQARFQMDLLIGAVPVRDIPTDVAIEVAKFQITEGRAIALIRGGGLSWAENQVKKNIEKYGFKSEKNAALGELNGLSCRWQPLTSSKGSILTMLVKPVDPAILNQVVDRLAEILGGDIDSSHPVHIHSAKYKSLWQVLRNEIRYEWSWLSGTALKRALEILLSIWSFRLKLPAPFDAKGYVAQIPSHSDYRKFDDMLRMVLDCTSEEIDRIRDYLESLRAQGKIFYGLHVSNHALMTCLVENIGQGGHIHFVDGGNGGYTIAAKQLKDQLRTTSAYT